MTAAPLPSADALRAVPELAALATLAVALALAREAIVAGCAEEADPFGACPNAADLVLHHLAALDGALTRYRALCEDRYLRTIF
jgi:hypothetical protein